jgi:type I restriction enzyme M protein
MALVQPEAIKNHAAFVWSVADLLRGDYKQSEYGRVILPMTVLRRLDCVLEPTKDKVLDAAKRLAGKVDNVEPVLCQATGEQFFNTSPLDLRRLLDDPGTIADNLRAYIAGFSASARDILEHFEFDAHIDRLNRSNLLYAVVGRFVDIDLHPSVVSNLEMGYLYEELIRKFSELSNETAGEHFTPREVIRLMVNLLFAEDGEVLTKPGIKRTLFDPACGTGGMLSVAEDHLRHLNPSARLEVYGQELNPETYATCRADMMLKGQDASHIAYGNSFSEDGFDGEHFDYMLANPPFGVEWKKVEKAVKDEAATKGFAGRFGAGLPRINDGSFLFLQHMISKMKPVKQGGSRLAIVFNGSPLFTGAAGSGESEIRRWIIENDWLDAIVALPDQLFYNTGISTYFWIVTNRKTPERKGTVQLIDARDLFVKMRKSLGEKRKEISADQIAEITRLYHDHTEGDRVKVFPNEAFGYMRITVERPLRRRWIVNDATALVLKSSKVYGETVSAGVPTGSPPASSADVAAAVDGILQRCLGQSFDSRRALEAALASAALDAWVELGWEDLTDGDGLDYEGALADMMEIKPAKARALLDCFAVRDEDAPALTDRKGNAEPDPDLRDNENVPLPAMPVTYEAEVAGRLETPAYRAAVDDYVEAEVKTYVPDAWVDHSKTKIGYEVPLTRHFYKYVPPRPLAEIDAEIEQLEAEIQDLLREVTE